MPGKENIHKHSNKNRQYLLEEYEHGIEFHVLGPSLPDTTPYFLQIIAYYLIDLC